MRAGAVLALAGAALTRANVARMPQPVAPDAPWPGPVTVCVPARDEAQPLPALLADLTAQTGVPGLRVLVLDDASTDATAALVRTAAAADPRISLHTGAVLPDGWLGKPHACHQLAALAGDAPVLVFLDADVRLQPHALAAVLALRAELDVALLSPWPRQLAQGILERLVQPLQQWSWLTTVPLGVARRSTRPSFAAANGQLLVVDATAYRAVGGHRSVAGEVVEDVALARVLRRAGHRTATVDSDGLAECRMYTGAAELRAGYGKSLWTALGTPPAAAALLAGLLGIHLLPTAAAVGARGRTRWWGLLGALASVDSRAVAARTAGTRVWPDSLAHPLGVLALAALTLDSHRGRRRGELRWKGRALG